MDPLPDSYIDSMPCDPDPLVGLGRVTWAAARLHSGVRDAINHLDGQSSDDPFHATLGSAIAQLRVKAVIAERGDIVQWVDATGRPAKNLRNKVIHAVSHTAADGKQALATADHSAPGRYTQEALREVTRELIAASMQLPKP